MAPRQRQTYRGLFGLIAVDDDDESKLRTALSVVPGETEIPLVLQDRRSASRHQYSPSIDDQLLGWYGDEVTVNFTPRPYLDVATRRYRFRVLNASNARNFRLAFRRDDGAAMPFLLLGTDGGLIERAIPCNEVLVSPAERIDLLVDFAGMPVGGYAMLESRAFDPMHALPARPAEASVAPSPRETHDMRAPAKREAATALVRRRRRAATAAVPNPHPRHRHAAASGAAFRAARAACRHRRASAAARIRQGALANQ